MNRNETGWNNSSEAREAGGNGNQDRHLNEDALLDQLYGLQDHRAHLEHCMDCSARWQDIQERRAKLAPAVEIPSELLWAQRRKIHARLGQERGNRLAWAPALAAAGLLAIGALVYRPAAPVPQHADANDAQIFAE